MGSEVFLTAKLIASEHEETDQSCTQKQHGGRFGNSWGIRRFLRKAQAGHAEMSALRHNGKCAENLVRYAQSAEVKDNGGIFPKIYRIDYFVGRVFEGDKFQVQLDPIFTLFHLLIPVIVQPGQAQSYRTGIDPRRIVETESQGLLLIAPASRDPFASTQSQVLDPQSVHVSP